MACKGSSWQDLDKGLVASSLTYSWVTALKSLSSTLHNFMSSVSEKEPIFVLFCVYNLYYMANLVFF